MDEEADYPGEDENLYLEILKIPEGTGWMQNVLAGFFCCPWKTPEIASRKRAINAITCALA